MIDLPFWLLFGAFVVTFYLYFTPGIIAWLRNHHNQGAIAILNLLLGWTFLGWVAALVWSLTNPPKGE
jgi:hypothetical protein